MYGGLGRLLLVKPGTLYIAVGGGELLSGSNGSRRGSWLCNFMMSRIKRGIRLMTQRLWLGPGSWAPCFVEGVSGGGRDAVWLIAKLSMLLLWGV